MLNKEFCFFKIIHLNCYSNNKNNYREKKLYYYDNYINKIFICFNKQINNCYTVINNIVDIF